MQYRISLNAEERKALENTELGQILDGQQWLGNICTLSLDALLRVIEIGQARNWEWDEKFTALCCLIFEPDCNCTNETVEARR